MVGHNVQPDGEGVPSFVFTRYAYGRADITGGGGGAVGKGKRARAVGVGVDAETKRAAAAAAWLAADDIDDDTRAAVAAVRAEIAGGIVEDQAVERSILALCGGQAWAFGRGFPSLNSGGMASRAARYVWCKRGVEPSSESIVEAAAAAAGAVWEHWTGLEALLGVPSFSYQVGGLAAVGWRAAFRSLTASARAVNGRHAEAVACVPLDGAAAAVDRESVARWARVGDDGERPGRADAARRFARRCAVDWLAGVLGAARGGRGGQAARAQVTLLAWIVCGADWARAAAAARFASPLAAVESFRAGKVWHRLEAAAVGRQTERERALVRALRVAGLAAGAAVKVQRERASGAGARGVAGYVPTAKRRAVGWRRSNASGERHAGAAVETGERRAVIASPLAAQWAAAADRRAAAMAAARALRRAVDGERAAKSARWRTVSKGLRAGGSR